jgi:hypothetical protein
MADFSFSFKTVIQFLGAFYNMIFDLRTNQKQTPLTDTANGPNRRAVFGPAMSSGEAGPSALHSGKLSARLKRQPSKAPC